MTRIRTAAAAAALAILLAACGGSLGSSGAGVAARIGSRTITTQALAASLERSLENEAFKRAVGEHQADLQRTKLTDMVSQQLVEEAARRLGVTVSDSEVQERLDEIAEGAGGIEQLREQAASRGVAPDDIFGAVRGLVMVEAVGRKLVADVQVTDAQVEAYYKQNIGQYDRIRAAHILVETRAEADRVLRQLRGGADFAALARRISTDEASKGNGGDLGFQGRGALQPAFERVVFATKPGELGGPVRTQFGWHVVKTIERDLTSMEEAREEIEAAIIKPRADEARAKYLADLAKELGVWINPRFGSWDAQKLEIGEPDADYVSPEPGAVPDDLMPQPGVPATPSP